MPIWLLRMLPYGAAALALIAAVWYIDHRGFKRAEHQAEEREKDRQLQLAATAILINKALDNTQGRMQEIANSSDRSLADTIRRIDGVSQTIIQPTLVKEIASDSRFTNPDVGITRGMLDSINAARQQSHRPHPPSVDRSAPSGMPSREPAH